MGVSAPFIVSTWTPEERRLVWHLGFVLALLGVLTEVDSYYV